MVLRKGSACFASFCVLPHCMILTVNKRRATQKKNPVWGKEITMTQLNCGGLNVKQNRQKRDSKSWKAWEHSTCFEQSWLNCCSDKSFILPSYNKWFKRCYYTLNLSSVDGSETVKRRRWRNWDFAAPPSFIKYLCQNFMHHLQQIACGNCPVLFPDYLLLRLKSVFLGYWFLYSFCIQALNYEIFYYYLWKAVSCWYMCLRHSYRKTSAVLL